MANFAILRTGKLKSSASIRGMLKHNFRDIDTPNADEKLTPENEHLAAQSVKDGMRQYRDLLPDKVRSNAVHAIDYMITTSKEATPEAKEAAMQEAYDWLAEKHGKENIIMASKHRDETTPHIHILVVPIDEKGKLNAAGFIGGTKHRMSDLQDEFYNRLKDKKINLDRGIKGSRAKHQSIKQWHAIKEHEARQENENVIAKVNAARERQRVGVLKRPEPQSESDFRAIKELTNDLIMSRRVNKELREKLKASEQTHKSNESAVKSMSILRKAIKTGDVAASKKITGDITSKTEAKAQQKQERAARRPKSRGFSR